MSGSGLKEERSAPFYDLYESERVLQFIFALCSIVDQPTRGTNKFNRIYVSEPNYSSIKVVTSTEKNDHKAVVAYTGRADLNLRQLIKAGSD